MTLALNVAGPLVAGQYGKTAFDAVGPLLLIGWAEVGPDLLRALTITGRMNDVTSKGAEQTEAVYIDDPNALGQMATESSGGEMKHSGAPSDGQSSIAPFTIVDDDLLERAREADACHWGEHRRPISADTLRRKLRIGAGRSRLLVAILRADSQPLATTVASRDLL